MSDTTPQPPADDTPPVPPAPPAYPQQPSAAQPGYPQQPPAYQQPAYAQPAYQQPAYQQPGYPQQSYAYAGPRTNTLAIVSLIAGIAAFVIVPVIGSIVAVITGHMSLKQLQTSGESGRPLALTGTILGWVGIGLMALLAIFLVFWFVVFVGAVSTTTYNV